MTGDGREFPQLQLTPEPSVEVLSFRDWLAGRALPAAINLYRNDPEQVARYVYLIADAVMEERQK